VRPADLAAAVRIRADLASDAAREAREAAGITAADMARTLGVSRQAVSSWETGAVVPTLEHALAYGRVLRELARTGRQRAAG
jgi:DNA-binding XRE family transcriptional regulator